MRDMTDQETAAALFDEIVRLREDVKHWQEVAHYATGVADLAMKHRDMAEAENARLREQLGLDEEPEFIAEPRAALDTQTGRVDPAPLSPDTAPTATVNRR
jgi:hypothetical protein